MIAYIILAHRNPSMLRRLVLGLASPQARFFIHIDKKVHFGPYQWALDAMPEQHVHFLDRIDTRWGEYSLVEATLAGLQAATADAESFRHYILLSGQSYPLARSERIEEYLDAHDGHSFLDYQPLPDAKSTRIEKYYFPLRGWRRVYPDDSGVTGVKDRIIQAVCRRIFPLPRILPYGLEPYFGSQWWCLSEEAVRYTLEYLQEHRDYVRHQRYCDVPDEMFFQTVLAGANDAIRDAIVNKPFHYAIWDGDADPSPTVLTTEHFDQIAASGSLFARKFDPDVDTDILDRIDAELIKG